MFIPIKTGLYIHYDTHGSGDPIVFLHPAGLNGDFWNPEIRALQCSHQVIAIDFRGHGLSSVPSSPFTLEDLANDVNEVLHSIHARPAIIVGLSLGGMVGQLLAIHHPEAVRGLVLVDTLFDVAPAVAVAMEARSRKVMSQGMTAIINETLERWFSPDFLRFAPAEVAVVRKLLQACDPVVHAWTWRAIIHLDLKEYLSNIEIPVLVMVGEKDVSTPPSIAQKLAKRIYAAEYDVIPKAGHIAVREQPVWFLSRLMRFVNSFT